MTTMPRFQHPQKTREGSFIEGKMPESLGKIIICENDKQKLRIHQRSFPKANLKRKPA
ncbi:hypothetical protein [Bartonella quintana]|nr:hypothetical protein [Bartonella quintana]